MKRAQPEAAIQRAVFLHLRTRGAPGVFAFHPANGGYRKPVEAAIKKGLGVTAGLPDVIAIHDGRVHGLEIKAPGGQISAPQLATLAQMREAGAVVAVAVGLDQALRQLEGFGLLRGKAALSPARMRPRCRRRS
jgi:hypothetical protein